jgi:3-oxoacyl-[acyl-carrier-protein] synthase II
VVITGLGAISSLGLGKDGFWDSLRQGRSGIKEIGRFDPSLTNSRLGGEVSHFDPRDFIPSSRVRRLDRVSQMAVAAARLAYEDADLSDSPALREEAGVVLGSGLSGLVSTESFFRSLLEFGPAGANPMLFPSTVPNAPASQVAIEMGLKGPNVTLSHKEVSGENAVIYGSSLIRQGRADLLLAGAVDELCQLLHLCYWKLGSLSPPLGEEELCCPFDGRRNGIILGEGSGMVVLEEASHALARGAKIYAEITGWGMSGSDCRPGSYARDGEGLARAMEQALGANGSPPPKPGVIVACANSTPELDRMEADAIRRLWGEEAGSIPVTAPKSMLGEFHSCGGLRIVAAALCLQYGWIPPTINYRVFDPECPLDCVPNQGRAAELDSVLVTGSSSGGGHACLWLRKFLPEAGGEG